MLPASRFEWAKELPADPGSAKMTAAEKLTSMRDGSRDGHRQSDLPQMVTEFYLYLPPEKARAVAHNWGKTCGPPALTEEEVDECCNRQERWRNGKFVADVAAPKSSTDPRARLREFVSRLTETNKVNRTVPTYLSVVDKALGGTDAIQGGFDPGSLVYIPAEKGTGKSIFTNHETVQTAKRARGALYCCPEMSYDDQMDRIFAACMGRPTRLIRNHRTGRQPVTELDIRAYEHAESLIAGWPLVVRDDTFTLPSIVEAVETWPRDWPPLELLTVDSPHVLLPPPGFQPGRAALEANSAGLMALTKKHGLVTLAPCQISRPEGKAKEASNWRPTRWSLRDSEALGHHCDIMLLLYREKKSRVLELNIAKGRNGEGEDDAEWLQVEFDGMHARLGNVKGGASHGA